MLFASVRPYQLCTGDIAFKATELLWKMAGIFLGQNQDKSGKGTEYFECVYINTFLELLFFTFEELLQKKIV